MPDQPGPLAFSDSPGQAWKSVCICGGVAPLKAARLLPLRLEMKEAALQTRQAVLTLLVPTAA